MPRQGEGLCQGTLVREILVLPLYSEEAAQAGEPDTGQACQAMSLHFILIVKGPFVCCYCMRF